MVRTAEAAIDDHQPAAALDGTFAVLFPHRHMAVDDMVAARQAELCQNAAAYRFVIIPCIIRVFHLGVGGAVRDIKPFKGGHGAAAEQR